MKNSYKTLALFVVYLFLTGCDNTKNASTVDNAANQAGGSERENPLQGQVDALNKAKNLEAEMQKSVEDRLKAIDGQK